jgi:hypothetical protein
MGYKLERLKLSKTIGSGWRRIDSSQLKTGKIKPEHFLKKKNRSFI